ncbi:MAG: hypothetical protein AAGM22_12755 [Acidobacteriota bacterium]
MSRSPVTPVDKLEWCGQATPVLWLAVVLIGLLTGPGGAVG